MPLTEQDKIKHLLRRFGLGASQTELDYYGQGGLNAAINRLLNSDGSPDFFQVGVNILRNPQNNNLNINGIKAWWFLRLTSTSRPLEQQLTLFWHDHFAVSSQKVQGALAMYNYLETLRRHGDGEFLTLLTAVSKDPAMLFWLDNWLSRSGSVNENFAREVMELFTLGVGEYTEDDIQEAARAFTGWTIGEINPRNNREFRLPQNAMQIRQGVFINDNAMHDRGEKNIFGQSGNFNGDAVLQMLVDRPECPRFIASKLWTWFAGKNPSNALIERIVNAWLPTNLNIKALVRIIVSQPEFYAPENVRSLIKHPVNFVVPTLRVLGIGTLAVRGLNGLTEPPADRNTGGIGLIASQATRSMGMDLLTPPDVAGWEGGEGWITTSTMVERIKWAGRLFRLRGGDQNTGPALIVLGLIRSNPTPENLALTLCELFDADLPAAKVQKMAEAAQRASGATLNERNITNACVAAAELLFGTPEFQFC